MANGNKVTTVALTDAVKRKSGFSNIFVRRSENLSGDGYAPLGKLKIGDRMLTLPEIDPKTETLFSGLFLGHPDVAFDAESHDPMLLIAPIKFRIFQLVALFSLQPMRSHYSSELAHNTTHDPAAAAADKKQLFQSLMTGKLASDCVRQYRATVWEMTRKVLNWELREATNPLAIKDIKARLRQLPKKRLVRTRLGKGKQSVRILLPE